MRSFRTVDLTVYFTQEAALEALAQTLARARIETVLAQVGITAQCTRKRNLVLAVL